MGVSRARARPRTGRGRCADSGAACRGCSARGSRRSSARCRGRSRSPCTSCHAATYWSTSRSRSVSGFVSADFARRRNSPSTSAASDGEKTGSPAAAARSEARSSSIGVVLTRYPAAPAATASSRSRSASLTVRITIGQTVAHCLHDRQTTSARHVEIADHQVGSAGGDDVDRSLGVVGLADDLEVAGKLRPQARADQRVVVGEHGPDRVGHVGDPVTWPSSRGTPRCRLPAYS